MITWRITYLSSDGSLKSFIWEGDIFNLPSAYSPEGIGHYYFIKIEKIENREEEV